MLRIRAGGSLSDQMEPVIQMLAEELIALKPATEEAQIDHENESMWNMERS